MYRIVMNIDGYLLAVDIEDLAKQGNIEKAFKHRLDATSSEGQEIIGGGDYKEMWYERRKTPRKEENK